MPRPIAKDHAEKRLHILKEAARVFAEEGIARASMAQVAVAAGVSKANIYHYYDSKHALLFDILDSYLCALRDRLAGLDLNALTPD
ncbi:MAG: helix-turn-helix domain-containing protein, partial [Planktotalea sp.]|uniref:TetR/AcrR family transcriptional regulator n=1 Tax=Planktotalea sp. TaxID=2029877 RepID=UPI003C763841